MPKLYSFNRNYRLWFMTAIATVMIQQAHGIETQTARSAEVLALLQFVPKSTVSVFCVDLPFKLKCWDDLTQASVFESATCFTTMLAQHDTQLGLSERKVCCAVSAIRSIRDPKRSPTKPVLDGPFQGRTKGTFYFFSCRR